MTVPMLQMLYRPPSAGVIRARTAVNVVVGSSLAAAVAAPLLVSILFPTAAATGALHILKLQAIKCK